MTQPKSLVQPYHLVKYRSTVCGDEVLAHPLDERTFEIGVVWPE